MNHLKEKRSIVVEFTVREAKLLRDLFGPQRARDFKRWLPKDYNEAHNVTTNLYSIFAAELGESD